MLMYRLPKFARLAPRTPWQGDRIAPTDFLALTDAARMASTHAGKDVTVGDILRAAARGEITLLAICPRAVTMVASKSDDQPYVMCKGHLPVLPLSACKSLAVIGRADWRTIDGFETAMLFEKEMPNSGYDRWYLPAGEPDLMTTPDDCRITGRDVHALADTFIAKPEAGEHAPAVETTAEAGVPASETPEKRRARWLGLYGDGGRGAVQRVYERELLQNPKADRSYIGKQIKKARGEQAEKKRGGQWTAELVRAGKR